MDVLAVALRTLRVTGSALLVAFALGVPAGAVLGMGRLRALRPVVNAGMGLPPTAAGLLVAWLVSRSGPLALGWGCTVGAMVAAQVLIATPIVAGLVMAAVAGLPADLHRQVRVLGARGLRRGLLLLREARVGVLAAVMAAYGGIVSEMGAAQMTGCSLSGTGASTSLLTTAAVEEVRRGRFGRAAALTAVLLVLLLAITTVLTRAQAAPGTPRRVWR